MNTKDKSISIADFNVEKLAELSGKKDEQLKLVDENPFIEITDTETSNEANKRRTALRTGRTTLEKEEKEVIAKIKEIITEPVKDAYKNLIAITTPYENKQQVEIDRYKNAKEEERKAVVRKENERVNGIKNIISDFVHKVKSEINSLNFQTSLNYEIPLLENDFHEFKSIYLSEVESLKFVLSSRKDFLKQQEKNRIDALKIKEQQDEAKRIQDIRDSIWEYSQNWIKKINNAAEESIQIITEEFLNQGTPNFAEFQKDFEFKRNELTVLLDQKSLQIKQQAEYTEQQAEMLEFKRRKEISILGFDFNTLIYENNGNRIELALRDILGTEQGFQNIFNNLKLQIEDFNKPKVETPTPIPSEIPSQLQQEMHSPTNMTTFQNAPQSKPLTSNQKKSIEFISKFVSFCNGKAITNELIENYVVLNVK